MRIATFNLESLDLPPKARVPLEVRAEVLRPALRPLRADVLCLQEVNGQHLAGQHGRGLFALDQLLAGTPYTEYSRVATTRRAGHGVADVHNLVTLSRFPIRACTAKCGISSLRLHPTGSRQRSPRNRKPTRSPSIGPSCLPISRR